MKKTWTIPWWSMNQKICKNVARQSCKRMHTGNKILASFSIHLQDYLKDESKSLHDESNSLQESRFLIQIPVEAGQPRKGADFCSSKLVLAVA